MIFCPLFLYLECSIDSTTNPVTIPPTTPLSIATLKTWLPEGSHHSSSMAIPAATAPPATPNNNARHVVWLAMVGISRRAVSPSSSNNNVSITLAALATISTPNNRLNDSPTPPNGWRANQASTNVAAAIGGARSVVRSRVLKAFIEPCGMVGCWRTIGKKHDAEKKEFHRNPPYLARAWQLGSKDVRCQASPFVDAANIQHLCAILLSIPSGSSCSASAGAGPLPRSFPQAHRWRNSCAFSSPKRLPRPTASTAPRSAHGWRERWPEQARCGSKGRGFMMPG